jgi:hypothetical protein
MLGARRQEAIMANKILALLLALSTSAAPSSVASMYRPVALDKNSKTHLYVLDSRGNIFVRDGSQFRPIASIPFGSHPVDIVSASFDNQEYIFVCSALIGQQQTMQQNAVSSSPTGYGLITQFTAAGRVVKQWRLPDLCGGFDITREHIVYFAGARDPMVFSFSIDDPHPTFTPVGYVKGARTLGPLIFDDVRNRIYTGDVASGTVFMLDPAQHEARVLSTAFAEPQAFALSPDRSDLFIADGSKGVVWRLPLNTIPAQPVPFSNVSFRRPSGLAPGANGHLWVADSLANQCLDVAPAQQFANKAAKVKGTKPASRKATVPRKEIKTP